MGHSLPLFSKQSSGAARISVDTAVLEKILTEIGVDASAALGRSREQVVKDGLRQQTAWAQEIGIFGAPTFITADGELFWGDDRLEQALAWARKAA